MHNSVHYQAQGHWPLATPVAANTPPTLPLQSVASPGPSQLQANMPAHTAPAPAPTPAPTPFHPAPNELEFVYTTFEPESPTQSESATATVSIAATLVPFRPTQAQINSLNHQCNTVIKRGRLDVCRAILTGTDGVPSLKPDEGSQRSKQDEIVIAAITTSVQSIAGESATLNYLTKENCDKIMRVLIQTPSRLRKKNQAAGFRWPPKVVQIATPSQ